MSGLTPESEQPSTDRRTQVTVTALAALLWLLLVGVVFYGPVVAPSDPYQTNPLNQFAPPGPLHRLGTDELGRDILSRFLWGGRASLGSALLASAVAALLGGALTLFAMLDYRWLDRAIGYVLDVMLSFPGLLVALIAITLLGKGPLQIAIAVGLSLAPTFARLMRGSIAVVIRQPYISAARALGADRWWVLARHVLRNIAPSTVSIASVILAWALLDCAALEFLGLAGSPEDPTWGSMIGQGRVYIHHSVWMVLAPSIALSASVFGLTLLDTLRRRLTGVMG